MDLDFLLVLTSSQMLFQDQTHDGHALLNFSVPSVMKTTLPSPVPGLHTEAEKV